MHLRLARGAAVAGATLVAAAWRAAERAGQARLGGRGQPRVGRQHVRRDRPAERGRVGRSRPRAAAFGLPGARCATSRTCSHCSSPTPTSAAATRWSRPSARRRRGSVASRRSSSWPAAHFSDAADAVHTCGVGDRPAGPASGLAPGQAGGGRPVPGVAAVRGARGRLRRRRSEHGAVRREEIRLADGERVDHRGIEMRPGSPSQLGERVVPGHAVAIGAVVRHRVERVGDREDPGAERNVVSARRSG